MDARPTVDCEGSGSGCGSASRIDGDTAGGGGETERAVVSPAAQSGAGHGDWARRIVLVLPAASSGAGETCGHAQSRDAEDSVDSGSTHRGERPAEAHGEGASQVEWSDDHGVRHEEPLCEDEGGDSVCSVRCPAAESGVGASGGHPARFGFESEFECDPFDSERERSDEPAAYGGAGTGGGDRSHDEADDTPEREQTTRGRSGERDSPAESLGAGTGGSARRKGVGPAPPGSGVTGKKRGGGRRARASTDGHRGAEPSDRVRCDGRGRRPADDLGEGACGTTRRGGRPAAARGAGKRGDGRRDAMEAERGHDESASDLAQLVGDASEWTIDQIYTVLQDVESVLEGRGHAAAFSRACELTSWRRGPLQSSRSAAEFFCEADIMMDDLVISKVTRQEPRIRMREPRQSLASWKVPWCSSKRSPWWQPFAKGLIRCS